MRLFTIRFHNAYYVELRDNGFVSIEPTPWRTAFFHTQCFKSIVKLNKVCLFWLNEIAWLCLLCSFIVKRYIFTQNNKRVLETKCYLLHVEQCKCVTTRHTEALARLQATFLFAFPCDFNNKQRFLFVSSFFTTTSLPTPIHKQNKTLNNYAAFLRGISPSLFKTK